MAAMLPSRTEGSALQPAALSDCSGPAGCRSCSAGSPAAPSALPQVPLNSHPSGRQEGHVELTLNITPLSKDQLATAISAHFRDGDCSTLLGRVLLNCRMRERLSMWPPSACMRWEHGLHF